MLVLRSHRAAAQMVIAVYTLAFATLCSASSVGDDKAQNALLVVQGVAGEPVRLTEADFKKLPRVEVEATERGGRGRAIPAFRSACCSTRQACRPETNSGANGSAHS
jgi:hypothetical protein